MYQDITREVEGYIWSSHTQSSQKQAIPNRVNTLFDVAANLI